MTRLLRLLLIRCGANGDSLAPANNLADWIAQGWSLTSESGRRDS
jgi:hypothetical protein